MHEDPTNTLEACVWEASRIVDDVRARVPFVSLMSRVKKRDESDEWWIGHGERILERVRGWRKERAEGKRGKDVGVILTLEDRFKGEDEKMVVFRGLEGDREGTLVAVGIGGVGGTKELDRFVQGKEKHEFMRETREEVEGVGILSTEVIALPYQVARARLNGADGVVLMVAVLPVKDLEYMVKMVKVLGMMAIVECHNVEEIDAGLGVEQVDAVLLVRRDLNTMKGTLEGFEEMYQGRRSQLLEKDVVVFAEGGERRALERVEEKADVLIMVPPPLVTKEMWKQRAIERQRRIGAKTPITENAVDNS